METRRVSEDVSGSSLLTLRVSKVDIQMPLATESGTEQFCCFGKRLRLLLPGRCDLDPTGGRGFGFWHPIFIARTI